MSRRLEDLITNNRDEFDELEPSPELWDKIEQRLPIMQAITGEAKQVELPKRQAKTFSLGFVMRVAALVFGVMAAGFVFYIKTQKTNDTVNVREIAKAIDPEYAKEQAHYAKLVNTKRTELKTLAKNDPQLYKEFSAELAQMDSTYNRLKKDLATSPDQESVLHAMIRNLQIQAEVLNQQLQVIEQFNEMKKEQSHVIKNI